MKEEVPPEYLWEDSEGLDQWWATIQDRRERGIFGGRPPAADGDEPDPEMAENDFARALKRG